jgi:hypothetical protein
MRLDSQMLVLSIKRSILHERVHRDDEQLCEEACGGLYTNGFSTGTVEIMSVRLRGVGLQFDFERREKERWIRGEDEAGKGDEVEKARARKEK